MKKSFRLLWAPSALMLMLVLLISSCVKDSSADLASLLRTVPADAGFVATFNLERLAKTAGCSRDGDKIELSAPLKQLISSVKDPAVRQRLDAFLSGKSGVEVTDVVVFAQGYHVYISGLLNDPNAFKSFLSSDNNPYNFVEKNGVEVANEVAISGNQFWMVTVGDIDPLDVKAFLALDEKKSFASLDYAEKMLKSDHDLQGLISTGASIFTPGDPLERAKIQMALSTIFSDASYVEFSLKFKNETVELEAQMLNSKFAPAKCNLPTQSIDTKAVRSLSASGDVAFAIGLSDKFTRKIIDMLAGTGAFGKLYESILSPIDGTIVAVGNVGSDGQKAFSALIQTTGDNLGALTGMLEQQGVVWRRQGNDLLLTSLAPSGSLSGASFAERCKGAFIAVAIDEKALGMFAGGRPSPVKNVTATVNPHDGALRLKVKAVGAKGDAGLAVAMIEYLLAR